MSVISGTAYWASIQSPNTKFEPHRWSINVGNLVAYGSKPQRTS